MKVSEFIEWLKKQDQEATVKCVEMQPSDHYYTDGTKDARMVEFKSEEHSYYIDYRGSEVLTEKDPRFNKRYLFIGENI